MQHDIQTRRHATKIQKETGYGWFINLNIVYQMSKVKQHTNATRFSFKRVSSQLEIEPPPDGDILLTSVGLVHPSYASITQLYTRVDNKQG